MRRFSYLALAITYLVTLMGCNQLGGETESVPLIFETPTWREEPMGFPENSGEQPTAVILARFSDMMPITKSPELYNEAIFEATNSVNAFIKEISYNTAWLKGEVFGWYELNSPAPCDQEELVGSVIKETASNIDYNGYKRLIVITPQREGAPCRYPAGNGTIGLVKLEENHRASVMHVIWEGYINPSLRLSAITLTHELMHNFGMWHANALECGSYSLPSILRQCKSEEYGNTFSILGGIGSFNNAFHLSAFAKEWIGWIEEEQILTALESGRYVIYPLETGDSKAKAVRVPLEKPLEIKNPYTGEFDEASEYYIEFRQPIGFDSLDVSSSSNINFDGVFLYTWLRRSNHINFFNDNEQVISLLIDATPNSKSKNDDMSDALIRIGSTFYDDTNYIKIEPIGKRVDGGIVVQITL